MPEFWKEKSLSLPEIQSLMLKLVEKSTQFKANEDVRHSKEAQIWREAKIEMKRALLLDQRKTQRDTNVEEEKARIQQLKELEEEAKKLEEEKDNKRGKKDAKKSNDDEQGLEEENLEGEEEAEDEFYGFPNDQQLEQELLDQSIELSEDFEPSTVSFEPEDNAYPDGGFGQTGTLNDQLLTHNGANLQEIGFTSAIHEQVHQIRVEILFMTLSLLRYPLPTEKMVNAYEAKLGSVNIDFVKFLETPCWMDKFDEKMVDELTPETPYRTIYYKKLLFWIFRTSEGLVNVRKVISALRVFQFDGRRTLTFFDWINSE